MRPGAQAPGHLNLRHIHPSTSPKRPSTQASKHPSPRTHQYTQAPEAPYPRGPSSSIKTSSAIFIADNAAGAPQ